MAYFTPGLPTRIMMDASPVGLGEILEQKQSDGEYRPVYYASRCHRLFLPLARSYKHA